MKKALLCAGVLILLFVPAFLVFQVIGSEDDINVLVKIEAISPVTDFVLASSEESFAIGSFGVSEVRQAVFKDTFGVSSLGIKYSIGGIATSSSFYVEPGYRVDLVINDLGIRASYVFE